MKSSDYGHVQILPENRPPLFKIIIKQTQNTKIHLGIP